MDEKQKKTLLQLINEADESNAPAGMSDTITIISGDESQQIELGEPNPYVDSKEYHPAVDIVLDNGKVIKGEMYVTEKL